MSMPHHFVIVLSFICASIASFFIYRGGLTLYAVYAALTFYIPSLVIAVYNYNIGIGIFISILINLCNLILISITPNNIPPVYILIIHILFIAIAIGLILLIDRYKKILSEALERLKSHQYNIEYQENKVTSFERRVEEGDAYYLTHIIKISDLASSLLNSTFEFKEIINIVLNSLNTLIGAEKSAIFLKEENGVNLTCQGCRDWEELKENTIKIDSGEGLIRWAIQKRMPVSIWSINKDPLLIEQIGLDPFRFEMVIPLIYKDVLKGVLIIGKFKDIAKDERDERIQFKLVNTVASLAALSFENSRLFSEVERLAKYDGLTNLYNRQAFQKLFDKAIITSQRDKTPLSVIIADIDFFKKVNDTYGHIAGDMVLKNTASILKKHVRNTDIVGRYGGEEFVIIFPETDHKDVFKIAEHMREQVEKASYQLDDIELRVTMSFGTATFPSNCNIIKDLLKNADEALYKAKEGGRNRVVS